MQLCTTQLYNMHLDVCSKNFVYNKRVEKFYRIITRYYNTHKAKGLYYALKEVRPFFFFLKVKKVKKSVKY